MIKELVTEKNPGSYIFYLRYKKNVFVSPG